MTRQVGIEAPSTMTLKSVLVVPAVSPAANVRDIVELAKKPLLNFSSGGNGVPARMG